MDGENQEIQNNDQHIEQEQIDATGDAEHFDGQMDDHMSGGDMEGEEDNRSQEPSARVQEEDYSLDPSK